MHGAVKKRLLDYAAVRLAKPDAASPLLTLVGASGVGETSLARLARGGARAGVRVGVLRQLGAAALPGGPLRPARPHRRRVAAGRCPQSRVRARRDRPPAGCRAAAALLDALRFGAGDELPRPLPRRAGRPVPRRSWWPRRRGSAWCRRMLRERMRVIEAPGYTDTEKHLIAIEHLLPLQLALHGLTTAQVRIGDDALRAVVPGYTHEPECGRVGRARRAVRQGDAPPGRRPGAQSGRWERRRRKA